MHEIRLVTLSFSNVLSYGSNFNEIHFGDGVTWIKGPNGSGKSTIIEALTFALFKVPYRGINNADLRNSANKGKLRVDLILERHDVKGIKRYQIIREMTKAGSISTQMWVDGVEMPKEAGISQKTFEEEVLGFNKNIFDNVISLNTIETTPFIDMDPVKKRKLTESVLTLHIDKFKEQNKKSLKEAKLKLAIVEQEVKNTREAIHRCDELVKQLELEQKDGIELMETQIETLKQSNVDILSHVQAKTVEISTITERGQKLKQEIDIYGELDVTLSRYNSCIGYIETITHTQKTYNEVAEPEYTEALNAYNTRLEEVTNLGKYDIDSYNTASTKLSQLRKEKAQLEYSSKACAKSMAEIETHVKELKVGVPCATCNKPSTPEDIEPIKAKYRIEWKELKKTFDSEVARLGDLETEFIECDALVQSLDDMKTKIQKANAQVENAKVLMNARKKAMDLQTSMIKSSNEKIAEYLGNGTHTVESIEKSIASLQDDVKAKRELEKELGDLRLSHNNLVNEKKALSEKISTNIKQISTLVNEINGKQSMKIGGSLDTLIGQKTEAETHHQEAMRDMARWGDEVAMTEYIEKMYNDDGIKKIVLGIFVPNLNQTVAHNFRLFNVPFMLEFDDAMEHKFASRYGMAPVYHCLSQGQKRKLNFAIAIAFRDFVTAIADFKINILFLDEVLDISTDEEALGLMIELLKEKVKEIGGIYVMTHRGENFADSFDHTIEIENDGTYSKLIQQKIN